MNNQTTNPFDGNEISSALAQCEASPKAEKDPIQEQKMKRAYFFSFSAIRL